MVKNEYKKNLQDFNLSCRFVYIYSKWDATANRYIVPKIFRGCMWLNLNIKPVFFLTEYRSYGASVKRYPQIRIIYPKKFG